MAWNERNIVEGIKVEVDKKKIGREIRPLNKGIIPDRASVAVKVDNNNKFKMGLDYLYVYVEGLGGVDLISHSKDASCLAYNHVDISSKPGTYRFYFENLKADGTVSETIVLQPNAHIDINHSVVKCVGYEGCFNDGTTFEWKFNKDKKTKTLIKKYGSEVGYLTGAMRRPDPVVSPSAAVTSGGWWTSAVAAVGETVKRPLRAVRSVFSSHKPKT